MLTLITVNHPDDLDGTDIPLIEGDLPGIASYLKDGTYLATARTISDGTESDPIDGTLTVIANQGEFRPFARTPGTVFGVKDADDDYLCSADCEALPDGEHVNPITDATIGAMVDFTATYCCGCGTTILDFNRIGGKYDVLHAVMAATGVAGNIEGTGGNCKAFVAYLDGGAYVQVTDGDAGEPDGIGMVAALYRDEDDDNPTVLHEGAHDPVALYRTVRAAVAA